MGTDIYEEISRLLKRLSTGSETAKNIAEDTGKGDLIIAIKKYLESGNLPEKELEEEIRKALIRFFCLDLDMPS